MKKETTGEKRTRVQKILVFAIGLAMFIGGAFSAPPSLAENTEGQASQTSVKGSDETSKEEILELKQNNGAVLFADNSLDKKGASSPAKDKVVLKYSKVVWYEGYSTHYFKAQYDGKTKVAYCVQPKEVAPAQGTWTATKYNNKLMMKALYYSYGYPGYDKKMRKYLSKKDIDDDYEDDYGAYALSHMILSYIYDKESANSDAFIGVSSSTKSLVKTVTNKIENDWPDPPTDASLSLSKTGVTAEWDEASEKQKTPVIKLKGHSDNKINVKVPSYATMVKTSDGVTKKYTRGKDNSKTVKVFAGDSFYFTAPGSVQGTFKSGSLEGSLSSFQPYIIKVTGKQDIVFCGVGSTASVSFTIKWAKLGKIAVKKSSANEKLTSDNDCYSLKGTVYGLYKKGTDTLYAKITTDKDGSGSVSNIPYGSYYLKEIKAPEGYELDTTTYDITLGETKYTKKLSDVPLYSTVEAILYKKDSESGKATSSYGVAVKGAHYRVNYYDGYYDAASQTESVDPKRSWVLETDADGKLSLDKDHLVEGDEFYTDADGRSVLPLGTVTMQEIKAPKGYVLSDDVIIRTIKAESEDTSENANSSKSADALAAKGSASMAIFASAVHEEDLIRGDMEFTKIRKQTGEKLKGIPFILKSKSTGESVTITTDKNGYFSTKDSDIWFGEGKREKGKGALPYGEYTLSELRCENNVGLQLVRDIKVVIESDNQVLDLGEIADEELILKTRASDTKDGDKELDPDADVSITDTVEYYGLEAGEEYVIKGVLMDKNTGDPILDKGKAIRAEKTFTAESKDGSTDVVFTFGAESLGGKTIVVFEELYKDGDLTAKHDDINSEAQTVKVRQLDNAPGTGDTTPWFLLIIAVTISALCGVVCLVRRIEQ